MDMDANGGDATLRDMLELLLGLEAFSHLGDDWERLPPPRWHTVSRICRVALARLGRRVADAGRVHPRLAGWLFGDASHCCDALAIHYWGGVFASSRVAARDDDRGARMCGLLSRLSLRQMRAHYLFYASLRRLLLAKNDLAGVDFDARRYRLATFVPGGPLVAAMAFMEAEAVIMGQLVSDMLTGLGQEALLDGSNTGSEEYLKRFFKSDAIHGEGIVFAPSPAGVQLFLWAFGEGGRPQSHFLYPAFDCGVEGVPPGVEGAALVHVEER